MRKAAAPPPAVFRFHPELRLQGWNSGSPPAYRLLTPSLSIDIIYEQLLRYGMNDSRFFLAVQPSGERIPKRRSNPALWGWIPAAVLAFGLCGAILHSADFMADDRVMGSADGAASYDPVDDDSPQDPPFAVPGFPFALSRNNRTAFLSGTVRLPSIAIAPPPPPPKI
jgi:hypothetical protein